MYRNMVKWGGVKIEKNTPPKIQKCTPWKKPKMWTLPVMPDHLAKHAPFQGDVADGLQNGGR